MPVFKAKSWFNTGGSQQIMYDKNDIHKCTLYMEGCSNWDTKTKVAQSVCISSTIVSKDRAEKVQ